MTMDQIEGNEPLHENFGTDLGEEIDEGGDPPRVWDATLEKPGCAFSRSIGDAVAKEVGVTAEPEILEWQITPKDKFAVVASDGVFEFITSQNVVDMIAKHTNKLEAAKQVVAEAYRLWLTYDDRTDDISIIIICFEDMKERVKAAGGAGGDRPPLGRAMSLSRGMAVDPMQQNNRPVRKVMSKNKRKDIAEDWNKEEANVFDFSNLECNKVSIVVDFSCLIKLIFFFSLVGRRNCSHFSNAFLQFHVSESFSFTERSHLCSNEFERSEERRSNYPGG
jgi:hypothetical protein